MTGAEHLARAPWSGLTTPFDDLRRETLRLCLKVAAIGYLIWHFARSWEAGERGLVHWPLIPAALLTLGGAAWLQSRWPRAAAWWFVLSASVSVAAALWLLDAPVALHLYPLLVLVAAVLLGPMAGAVIGLSAVALLAGLRASGLTTVVDEQVMVDTAVLCLLTLVAAWTLARNLTTTAEWAVKSADEAWHKTQEARHNRAELVNALKQLDHAYYQLRRANAALELAWKAADDAERARTEFVTSISHELRTPLNLVVGFSEMILTAPETYREPLPSAYVGDLNAIYRSAQHLLTLTNDVIDLARVGMGRLALAREPIALATVVADACALVREYVEAKGLWLRTIVPDTAPIVFIDRLRVRQVLLNLLTNAARFTERGGITITVVHDQDWLEARVSDTGPGIAPADLSQIFNEFFTDDSARAHPGHEPGGIGLGLPLSRRLIELHGGQLGVDSTQGQGSCFWFRLPISADRHQSLPAQPRSAPPSLVHADERILVLATADDQAEEFLQRHLPTYRLVTATDLRAALDLAVELRAAAVLTDADLPPHLEPAVPVLRAPWPRGDRLAAALGATAFLAKPITRARLYRALEQLQPTPRTILIVDDDTRFVRLLTRMLHAAPVLREPHIHIAPNGQVALSRLASLTPDLIILDLVMPDLDGIDTLRAIRSQLAAPLVPVLLLSAQDQLTALQPLAGSLTLVNPEGFQLEELLGATGSLLANLRPPRRYLSHQPSPAASGR